jgi:hypothetical protein
MPRKTPSSLYSALGAAERPSTGGTLLA